MMKKILVVDDEIFAAEIVQFHLENNGFNVRICDDPLQVSEILGELQYDLLITDWMMPGLNGNDLIQEVRANSALANLPVIVVTAKTMSLDEREFLLQNKCIILNKPFSPTSLVDKVVGVLT